MRTPTRRGGYTLFEVMLVAAVILLVAGLSYPSLRGMYGVHKMNGAVDTVRAGWAMARSRAIEEGRPYRFSVEPNGTHFRVAPDQSDYWSGGSGPTEDPSGRGMIVEKALPPGVRFSVNGEGASTPPPEDVGGTQTTTKVAGDSWNTAVVFQPDGTAKEDVRILFQVRGTRSRQLSLRGLTGNVSVITLPE